MSKKSTPWWRSAVIYQIYPRSFADSTGDGIGDLPGITARLPHLAKLGIDAIWLSPFMPSPQNDAGYDVSDYMGVDPLFGTLSDFEALLSAAHDHQIRVIVDLVPNHSSDQHPLFQEALNALPGSPERDRYIFRDGNGEHGEKPPNNWQSIFGGDAWTRVTEPDGSPGQWYLHLFDKSQPDFNWRNTDVRAYFERVLRFWLDLGVDGFRVDVAHGLVKDERLPDYTPDENAASMGGEDTTAPYFEQPGVHDIYREWHKLLAEYTGDRALCGEAWVSSVQKAALWVRPDEMQQTFNFQYLETPWQADRLRQVIDDSLREFGNVGAPSTWVLSNHDVIRHPTRLMLDEAIPQGSGIGAKTPGVPSYEEILPVARAAAMVTLALPGSCYIYQGEELGLPEVTDIPDECRQDPTWHRTGGEKYGRDGCRVPIPWSPEGASYGFNDTGASWLPQPQIFGELARSVQEDDEDSTLQLYYRLLELRRAYGLGRGELKWVHQLDGQDIPSWVLAFENSGVLVLVNMGDEPWRFSHQGSGGFLWSEKAVHADKSAERGVSETSAISEQEELELKPNTAVWCMMP